MEFLNSFSRDQGCCIALLLACGGGIFDTSVSFEIRDFAAQILFKYGGEPQFFQNQTSFNCKFIKCNFEIFIKVIAYDIGRPVASRQISYSGVHNGLALLLARTLEPIFKRKFLSFW